MKQQNYFANGWKMKPSLHSTKRVKKTKSLKIRLPYDEEWIFAALEGYAKIAFEKGYNTIYDETSIFSKTNHLSIE